ncbi:hypothetical protein BKA80DRAFT_282161 [Phyllosticta citrichinensis]
MQTQKKRKIEKRRQKTGQISWILTPTPNQTPTRSHQHQQTPNTAFPRAANRKTTTTLPKHTHHHRSPQARPSTKTTRHKRINKPPRHSNPPSPSRATRRTTHATASTGAPRSKKAASTSSSPSKWRSTVRVLRHLPLPLPLKKNPMRPVAAAGVQMSAVAGRRRWLRLLSFTRSAGSMDLAFCRRRNRFAGKETELEL